MMNRHEALRRISVLQEEIEKLQEVVRNPPQILTDASHLQGFTIHGGSLGEFLPIQRTFAEVEPKGGNNFFSTMEEAENWAKAIDTVLLLRRQFGTEQPRHDIWQFCLTPSHESVVVVGCLRLVHKLPNISPCFVTSEDAKLAIQNIGEPRLLQMFNTFHGMVRQT